MAINEKFEFDLDAPADLAYAVLLDVETLPDWSSSHKSAKVLERDAQGNPSLVEVEAALLTFSDTLTMKYEFTENKCKWDTVSEGAMVKAQGGYYQLTPNGDKTHVLVDMYIDPKIKVPGFVMKKGIKIASDIASKGFTKEVLKRKASS